MPMPPTNALPAFQLKNEPWLIHVNVWQNPLLCCEVISHQLIKINEKKKKETKKKKKKKGQLGTVNTVSKS